MKKLFISQPMNGKTEEEILVVRKKAIESAKVMLNEDVEVIESYFEDYNPDKGCVPLKYLAKSLELLADADVAYFAKGWESARGCRIENQCAIEYGIDTIEDYTNSNSEHGYNFGTALEILKRGGKVAREGWNGKGMFVVYQKGYPDGIPCNKQTAEAWSMNEGDLFKCNPYLQIKQVDGSHSMWVPSIGDVLAEDWIVVDK